MTEPDLPGWLTSALGPGARVGPAERLRFWGASEVWRVQVAGAAVIVKRGTGEMADEARRYRELVEPLGAPAPDLIGGADGVLVLADAGTENLEQRPTVEGYHTAVRTLAVMRATATERLAADPALGHGLRRSAGDFAGEFRRAAAAVTASRPDLAGALDDPARALAARLAALGDAPATLVHGDFHAKNIVHSGPGRVTLVDWPVAYAHPHLGDLYCLVREARKRGLAWASGLAGIFAAAAGADPAVVADQMVTGGLCWTVSVLRWLAEEEGARAVPESRDWIDELVDDMRTLARSAGIDNGR